MTPKRKFPSKAYQHLYQISANKSLLFCTVYDRILLFTLICVKARKYNVRITQLCIMFNHFHIQASMSGPDDMECFMSSVTWSFAIVFNHHFGLSGNVFHRPYGSAPKVHSQKIAGNMIYISNNPVGKKAVSCAWDYRWNFLRYAPQMLPGGRLEYSSLSRHPFSDDFNPLEASREMLYLVKTVRAKAAKGEFIGYEFFKSAKYEALCEKEKLQLIDIIIVTYNVIDYEPLLRKYGSIEQFCRILSEVEGCEYDLNDDWEVENYKHYEQMMLISVEEGYDLRKQRYLGVAWGGDHFSASGISRGRKGKQKESSTCLGKNPSHTTETGENGSLPQEKPEAQQHLMPAAMADKLIMRFRNEVGATNLEINKYLNIEEYGKH